jgi:hypothetical protein
MAAPKAHRSDARLFQVAQGAGRSGFPVFGQADAGHQFLLAMVTSRTRISFSLSITESGANFKETRGQQRDASLINRGDSDDEDTHRFR